MTIRAAGILYIAEGRALFLKRTDGLWCLPGGKVEGDETSEQAARREFEEETGRAIVEKLLPWTRRCALDAIAPAPAATPSIVPDQAPATEVDYTTFVVVEPEKAKPFDVRINDEHVGYAWAPPSDPPQPLHPGCMVVLDRLTMDELGVARAIMAGELTSPQRFHNVWLFDLRITGTGTAYRPAHEEITYRRPENYLTPDFLARCNGLQVIWQHPKKSASLNAQEFADRSIGAMFLPYIGDGLRHPADEVWGIAKVYDDEAADLMINNQLSTSPAVIIKKADQTALALEDGTKFLVEGKPFLLDHLAICAVGVWDKGGEPAGVEAETVTLEDSAMPDEKKDDARKDNEERKDAAPNGTDQETKADAKKDDDGDGISGKLDKVLEHLGDAAKRMDRMDARMDAIEGTRKDSTEKKDEEKEDKKDARSDSKKDEDEEGEKKGGEVKGDKRKDADDKDEKREDRADARADSGASKRIGDLEATIADMARRLPGALSDEQITDLGRAQQRADSVFQAFGGRAPVPGAGELPDAYRHRVAGLLKGHSTAWKDVDLTKVADPTAFANAESMIYADALSAARRPTDLKPGQLRMLASTDPNTGARINTFVGVDTFVKSMSPRRRPVRAIGTTDGRRH